MNTIQYSEELTEELWSELETANVYYSKQYRACVLAQGGSKIIYLYNKTFIFLARFHSYKGLFNYVNFPTEPFIRANSSASDIEFGEQQLFLDECISVLKKVYHVDWTLMPGAGSLFKAYPTNSKRIKFGNYILDMEQSEESIFSGFTSKHRNMVRRGEKAGIVIRIGGKELLKEYMDLDAGLWSRNHVDVDFSDIYNRIVDYFDQQYMIGIAYKDGTPQCGIFGIFNNSMFYYLFGATAERPEPGSTHYLQWQSMLWLKSRGVKRYNFVGCRLNVDKGSKYDAIQHFKSGFGGDLHECYLFKCEVNALKHETFKCLKQLRGHKEGPDIIDQEFSKWSEIN